MQFGQLKRRGFITLLGGAAVTWPLTARAQQPISKMPRVGIIDPGAVWDPFRQGLRDLGYIEGRDITIEYQSAEERPEQLVAAATESRTRATSYVRTMSANSRSALRGDRQEGNPT